MVHGDVPQRGSQPYWKLSRAVVIFVEILDRAVDVCFVDDDLLDLPSEKLAYQEEIGGWEDICARRDRERVLCIVLVEFMAARGRDDVALRP